MRFAFGAAFLMAADFAAAQAPRLFQLHGNVGDRHTYSIRTEMKAAAGKGAAGFEARIREKLSAKRPGEFVWEVAFAVAKAHDSGVLKGAAASFRDLDGLVLMRHTDRTGQTKKLMVGSIEVPSSGTPDLVFSKKPVRVGDSWEAVVESQGQKVRVAYRLAAYGRYGKVPAAKVEGTYKPGQVVKSLRPLIFWVDLQTGKTLFATGLIQATTPAGALTVSWELKKAGK
jgi:hypothetical protein